MTGGVSGEAGATVGRVVPTCYRHPDKETYILCTRCERPICPDCMNAAPVGFQCPECVQEGNKSVRQARTPIGGEVATQDDLVTKILIGVNALVFLISLAGEGVTARLGLYYFASYQGEPIGIADGEWYRLITASFVHAGLLHFLFNMYALWILGQSLEPVLGRWRFIALYIISALGGSMVSLLYLPPGVASVGASGAIFGLFGAVFVVTRRFGGDIRGILVLLGINLLIGFVFPGIDWRAHLGGLVTGAVLAAAFVYAPRKQRLLWSILACLIAIAVILVLVAGRANDFPL